MDFPQIRLQSQPVKLVIEKTPGQMSIEQPKADQSIQQPKADVKINTVPSKLNIDQTEAWADMGMKTMERFMNDSVSVARQDWMEGIARVARQGDELMKIENGGSPIASQAKENGFDAPKQFNIGWIPSEGSVKIDYQPAEVKIDISANKPVINTTPRKAIINYQPGSVNSSISQYQDLKIDFESLYYVGPQNFKMSI